MTQIQGMLTLDELAAAARQDAIDTVILAFSDHYGRLLGKRLDADYFLETAARQGTHACDYLLTTDMEMEPVPGYRFANWELGYGDFHLAPDLATLRRTSWLEKSALVLCDVDDERRHQPVAVAPRSILQRQLQAAEALGFEVYAASELEYYLFRDSYRDAHRKGYADLEPMGWYLEDYHLLQGARQEEFTAAVRRHLKRSGIPVESSKGEWGLGQHELNIRYADLLAMADRHSIMKQCLKEIAEAQGRSVTFMAKPFAGQAGSSCHIHLSLFKSDQNAFAGDRQLGPVQGQRYFSLFPRRLDGALAGHDGLLRADDQRVQALPRRLLGADAHRLELRQSHGRLPRGRLGRELAHRVPRARRRLQPVPGLRRCTGLGSGWHPQQN